MSFNSFRPRRVRLVESGWEGFTGVFGITEFKDGLSVLLISHVEQQRLGALIRIKSAEEEEENAEIGPGAECIRSKAITADDELLVAVDRVVQVGGEIRLVATTFTREELEEIADKKGLQGLREVAIQHPGVKGRSITDLITGILDASSRPTEPSLPPVLGSNAPPLPPEPALELVPPAES